MCECSYRVTDNVFEPRAVFIFCHEHHLSFTNFVNVDPSKAVAQISTLDGLPRYEYSIELVVMLLTSSPYLQALEADLVMAQC